MSEIIVKQEVSNGIIFYDPNKEHITSGINYTMVRHEIGTYTIYWHTQKDMNIQKIKKWLNEV